MFKSLASFAVIAAMFAAPAAAALGPADIERCQAMQATMIPKRNEIKRITAKRDDLAVKVETLGEAWQNAEAMRNLSPEYAKQADAAQYAYEEAERSFAHTERGLSGLVRLFNRDVAAFNRSCAAQ